MASDDPSVDEFAEVFGRFLARMASPPGAGPTLLQRVRGPSRRRPVGTVHHRGELRPVGPRQCPGRAEHVPGGARCPRPAGRCAGPGPLPPRPAPPASRSCSPPTRPTSWSRRWRPVPAGWTWPWRSGGPTPRGGASCSRSAAPASTCGCRTWTRWWRAPTPSELLCKAPLLAAPRAGAAARPLVVADEDVEVALDDLLSETASLTRRLLGGATDRPPPTTLASMGCLAGADRAGDSAVAAPRPERR